MARYTRNLSTFIHKHRHQLTNDGSILERDWTTLGERHVIERGKRRVYADSGFLFTESTRPGFKTRHSTEEWSGPYTNDMLDMSVNDDVNIVKLPDGVDIRNYAYYGSSVELVRGSIENIVKWFPGKAWENGMYVDRFEIDSLTGDTEHYNLFQITDDGYHNYLLKFDRASSVNRDGRFGEEVYEPELYVIRNPFDFDFFTKGRTFTKYENSMRNIPYSFSNYYMKGCRILKYDSWVKPYDACDGDFTVIYDAYIRYEIAPSVSRYDEFYPDYGVDSDCPELIEDLPDDECVVFLSSEKQYNEGHIYGIKYGNGVILCTDIKGFTLTPIPGIISSYFNNLDGFERLLLTKKTNPIYGCVLKTPVPKDYDEHGYYMVNRTYKFPSFGYCVLCDIPAYTSYVNSLYDMAALMDEMYTDNIWRNMTHESIRNFDWTYRKDFNDGDEIDNVFGGTRLKDVLRIYGRFFDDIKRYVDNIKLKNCVKWDGIGGLPNAELSDKAQLAGWEVYSTKTENTTNFPITDEYVNANVTKKLSRWGGMSTYVDADTQITMNMDCDAQPIWYPGLSPDRMTQNDNDNYFMRMINLAGPHIFRRKGTLHAIDMVYALFGIGENDYEVREYYYSVTPRLSSELVYAYRLVEPDEYVEYVDANVDEDGNYVYMTLSDYVESLGGTVGEDAPDGIVLNGLYYEKISYTLKDLCSEVNRNKVISLNYPDDEFSGIPIRPVTINGNEYIVPYFSQDRIYDGDVQFQTKGGWGKYSMDIDGYEPDVLHEYTETLPHTKILQNCASLMSVNQFDVNDDFIYYVMDLTDIMNYTQEDMSIMSHYFKLIDPQNPQLFSSWSNIPLKEKILIPYVETDDDETEEGGESDVPENDEVTYVTPSDSEYSDFCNEIVVDDEDDPESTGYPLRPLYYGITADDYNLMKYLDSIVMDNLGNNPHTGLGVYDLGEEYRAYLEQPFRYVETHNGFNDEHVAVMARNVRFDVTLHEGEKIVVNDVRDNDGDVTYYLPNKMLVIKNNINNFAYFEYFKAVIVKYLTQVIPSTTVLVFV